MAGFGMHVGRTAVYNADDVDTDRIIPARFLSRVERSGYGDLLFHDVRGADFPLDRSDAAGASILVVGANFGCGSSREHAVWAIQQAGFRAVVARGGDRPGYSDIFRSNAANCGLLLIELAQSDHEALAGAGSGTEATIDLDAQSVSWNGSLARFEINAATKDQLLQGLDLIGTTLKHQDDISRFEDKWHSFSPGDVSSATHGTSQ